MVTWHRYRLVNIECLTSLTKFFPCGTGCTGGIAPLIHNRGTGWRWVASFTSRPLYSRSRTSGPTKQETVWAPDQVGRLCKTKISSPCRDMNPGRPGRSLLTVPTELPRLLYTVTVAVTVVTIIISTVVLSFHFHQQIVKCTFLPGMQYICQSLKSTFGL